MGTNSTSTNGTTANGTTANGTTENTQQTASIFFSILLTCGLFIVPLFLIYYFVYNGNNSNFAGLLLFFFIIGLGYTVNLLYYRIMIMNDIDAKIDKMSSSDALYVLSITTASFAILGFTMLGISLNPGLITVFENTIGVWFIGFFGLSDLSADIFTSPMFDKIRDLANYSEFNYDFLITRITPENINVILDSIKKTPVSNLNENRVKFGLDFVLNLKEENTEQIKTLQNLVNLKHAAGHFTWIYLTSLVSLLVSMIAMIIGK
jgi:hypothetical protein